MTLTGISMTDSGNGWAVGFGMSMGGFIYHYDGTSWNLQRRTNEWLFDIAVINDSCAWAVGNSSDGEGGAIFFFNGSGWTSVYETEENLDKYTLWIVIMYGLLALEVAYTISMVILGQSSSKQSQM